MPGNSSGHRLSRLTLEHPHRRHHHHHPTTTTTTTIIIIISVVPRTERGREIAATCARLSWSCAVAVAVFLSPSPPVVGHPGSTPGDSVVALILPLAALSS